MSYFAPRTEAERMLDVLEHQFRALAECSADAVFVTDFDSAQFVHVNSKACDLFGYTRSELRGMTGRQLHPADDCAVVDDLSRELVQTGAVVRRPLRLQRKDGSLFWAELRSSVYSVDGKRLYVTFVRDISGQLVQDQELHAAHESLKSMEAQLLRSSRLAAIGQIATGVAHEVNNPAASALMNLQLLSRDLGLIASLGEELANEAGSQSAASEVRIRITEAMSAIADSTEAVERIASVVRGLSRFARIDEGDVRKICINDAANAALRLSQHQLQHVANVRSDLKSKREFHADLGKLTQVLVNLLTNARQAIETGGGGSITLRSEDRSGGVAVSVEDDGPGVDTAIAGHIFEPFFTTKGAEQGSGLGLSLCADIAHQHRGRLELKQRPGRGAVFELFIPVETGLSIPAPKPSEPEVAGGRVLVVDDDAPLVRAYKRWLGRKYDVVVAHDALEALELLEHDSAFDVIVCDLMMPRLDGVGLYEALSDKHPALIERLIFCSGGPTTRRCRDFIERPGIVFFEKPIRQEYLSECISRLIRRSTRPSESS